MHFVNNSYRSWWFFSLYSIHSYPSPPASCKILIIVRHSMFTRLGLCHVDHFLFFGPHMININGTLVICDQRHRMNADEFPGNRNTKWMTQNCKMVVQNVSRDPSLRRKCTAQTLRMPNSMCRQANDRKIAMEKGLNIAKRRTSRQGGKKVIARHRPNYKFWHVCTQ